MILNRFGETTYEIKNLYKIEANRETVHHERLTKCHIRKLNSDQPDSPTITTYTSNNDPQTHSTSQTQSIPSQPQQTTTHTSTHLLQQLTATAHQYRGLLKGSKNKITQSL
jgi:hypothetical protein